MRPSRKTTQFWWEPFMQALIIYLGVLAGYWLGATNGWESGLRQGREMERLESQSDDPGWEREERPD